MDGIQTTQASASAGYESEQDKRQNDSSRYGRCFPHLLYFRQIRITNSKAKGVKPGKLAEVYRRAEQIGHGSLSLVCTGEHQFRMRGSAAKTVAGKTKHIDAEGLKVCRTALPASQSWQITRHLRSDQIQRIGSLSDLLGQT
jgi:hypothetical protein